MESIKHFFNVEGIVFVLAIDRQQIGYSLQTLYGASMDTEGYLRRFIDLNFNLPQSKNIEFVMDLPQYFEIKKYIKSQMDREGYNQFLSNLKTFSDIYKLTPRDLEQLYSMTSISIRFFEPRDSILEILIPLLLVIKIKQLEDYQKFMFGRINVNDFLVILKGNKLMNSYLTDTTRKTELVISLYITGANLLINKNLAHPVVDPNIEEYDSKLVSDFLDKYPISNEYLKKIEEIIEFSGGFSADY